MKEKQVRRKFTKEFKLGAVKLCERKSVKEAAESLGLAPELLYKWRRDAELKGSDAFRGNGKRTALEEENWRLRQEVADLKEEQEILKKASAYFAKHIK